MGTVKKEKEDFLSIIDAVETLSSIADMDFGKDSPLTREEDFEIQEQKISYRTVNALKEYDANETLGIVREVFKVVLDYLKNFYRNDYEEVTDVHTLEGIKGIMLLVGEAAKKLDKYTASFYKNRAHSITELKEYRDLQVFYESRIAQKIDEGLMGKWILGLSGKNEKQDEPVKKILKKETTPELQSKYVFVDLETVKKDIEYELFYLRKEDGSRFFNPRVIRNMKLISDFGNYFGKKKDEDPLLELDVWKDRCAQASAVSLIRFLGTRIDRFVHETAHYRKLELAGNLHNALMALILSSHTQNLIRNDPIKNCSEYFRDFQKFLREALNCREYQKLIAYPPRSANKLAICLLETVHAMCRGMFIHLKGYHEMMPIIHELFSDSEVRSESKTENIESIGPLWSLLTKEYEEMSKKMRLHPNGPLRLILTALEDGECNNFAPLMQGDFPVPLYYLYSNEKKITSLRIPTPTSQHYVHKVHVEELFLGFLRACEGDHYARKNLIINLQDRTSWREIARCEALESLPAVSNFGNHLTVITLAADTDFYHQLAPYDGDLEFDTFKEHFKEHVNDQRAGFYFPETLKNMLFPSFFSRLVDAIHRVFFAQKKVLSQKERQDFILMSYFFLIFKVIEINQPDSYSMTCKDAIDIGGSFNMLVIAMVKILNNEVFHKQDIDCLHYLAYIPAFTMRERLMLSERFYRTVSVLRRLEELQRDYGPQNLALIFEEAFSSLYDTPILHATLAPPKE